MGAAVKWVALNEAVALSCQGFSLSPCCEVYTAPLPFEMNFAQGADGVIIMQTVCAAVGVNKVSVHWLMD